MSNDTINTAARLHEQAREAVAAARAARELSAQIKAEVELMRAHQPRTPDEAGHRERLEAELDIQRLVGRRGVRPHSALVDRQEA
jgi:hypothetical protein